MAFHRGAGTIAATITIATDNDLSSEADFGGSAVVGLIVPTLDTSTLTFRVAAASGGAAFPLVNELGGTISIAAGVGSAAISGTPLLPLSPYRFVSIATSGTQSANRTFTWVLKE